MESIFKKSLIFLIVWFSSGICFYLHQQGYHIYGYLVALICLIAFFLLAYGEKRQIIWNEENKNL